MGNYNVTSLPRIVPIPVGHQSETGVEQIGFDVSAWLAKWPDMTVEVWVTAPGASAAYQARTHMSGKTIVWDVTASDTITAGHGKVEVMGYADGMRKLSAVAPTEVSESILSATADPPESQQPWYERAMAASGNANWGAEDAGSLLYIGEDGLAHPLKLGAGLAIVGGVLIITNAQVVRAVCGTVLAGQVKCGEV